MGMYTGLVLDARLKNTITTDVTEVLGFMIRSGEGREPLVPDHDLFQTSRWVWMLNGDSAYFPVERRPILARPALYGRHETGVPTLLSVGFSIKNYDSEIEKFLDWLTPYLEEGIGWTMYEEDEFPTLILIRDGQRVEHE